MTVTCVIVALHISVHTQQHGMLIPLENNDGDSKQLRSHKPVEEDCTMPSCWITNRFCFNAMMHHGRFLLQDEGRALTPLCNLHQYPDAPSIVGCRMYACCELNVANNYTTVSLAYDLVGVCPFVTTHDDTPFFERDGM